MTPLAAHEAIPLELPGGSVPVLLFAGGTTGLVLLAGSQPGRAFCARLGETAEEAGLSAIAFADEIPGDAATASDRAVSLLGSLGVEQTVLVALDTDAAAGLRAAARAAFAGVILIEPRIPADDLEVLLADIPTAKLVLVARRRRRGAGHGRCRVPPCDRPDRRAAPAGRETMAGESAAMVAEATIAFAVGACGDGRRRAWTADKERVFQGPPRPRRRREGERLGATQDEQRGGKRRMAERNPEIGSLVASLQAGRSLAAAIRREGRGLGLSLPVIGGLLAASGPPARGLPPPPRHADRRAIAGGRRRRAPRAARSARATTSTSRAWTRSTRRSAIPRSSRSTRRSSRRIPARSTSRDRESWERAPTA